MKSIYSIIAGAAYSASYIAPSPYWRIFLVVSAVFVVLMRAE